MSDATLRLRRGLRALYRYYDANEQMLSNALRDMEILPAFVAEYLGAQLEGTLAALLEAWPSRDQARVRPAIGHAIDVRAWLSLRSQGLTPTKAAQLMATMIGGLIRWREGGETTPVQRG